MFSAVVDPRVFCTFVCAIMIPRCEKSNLVSLRPPCTGATLRPPRPPTAEYNKTIHQFPIMLALTPLRRWGISVSGTMTTLRCQGCNTKIHAKEAMTLFYRRFNEEAARRSPGVENAIQPGHQQPEDRIPFRRIIESNNWGRRKQRGVYDPREVGRQNEHVARLLNGGDVKCEKCGVVRWEEEGGCKEGGKMGHRWSGGCHSVGNR